MYIRSAIEWRRLHPHNWSLSRNQNLYIYSIADRELPVCRMKKKNKRKMVEKQIRRPFVHVLDSTASPPPPSTRKYLL